MDQTYFNVILRASYVFLFSPLFVPSLLNLHSTKLCSWVEFDIHIEINVRIENGRLWRLAKNLPYKYGVAAHGRYSKHCSLCINKWQHWPKHINFSVVLLQICKQTKSKKQTLKNIFQEGNKNVINYKMRLKTLR